MFDFNFDTISENNTEDRVSNSSGMNLVIDRNSLLKAISHVQNVVEKRNIIPILANIKLVAKNGKLELTSTDMDISAVEKLYFQYTANEKYNLIYACFGIRFENVHIHFDPDYLILFSPQFMPIYVNPRNDKIQATYHHDLILRTRKDFLKLLEKSSKSIALS